jgi:hypothetical protein
MAELPVPIVPEEPVPEEPTNPIVPEEPTDFVPVEPEVATDPANLETINMTPLGQIEDNGCHPFCRWPGTDREPEPMVCDVVCDRSDGYPELTWMQNGQIASPAPLHCPQQLECNIVCPEGMCEVGGCPTCEYQCPLPVCEGFTASTTSGESNCTWKCFRTGPEDGRVCDSFSCGNVFDQEIDELLSEPSHTASTPSVSPSVSPDSNGNNVALWILISLFVVILLGLIWFWKTQV